MTERHAGMSDEAAALYQQMLDEGMAIPERENLQAYRDDVRAGFEAFVQAALAGFEGRIEMLEIDGVACRQITPAGWQADSGRCMLYAYGGGYVSGSTHEDQIISVPLA